MTGTISSKICSLRSQKLLSLEVDCVDVACSCCTNCVGGSRINDIRDKILIISFKSDMAMPVQEKQARAAARDWITHVDQFGLDVSSDGFTERYILAVFYFLLNGDAWSDSEGWLHANKNQCDWKGIICDTKNNVNAIELGKFTINFPTLSSTVFREMLNVSSSFLIQLPQT